MNMDTTNYLVIGAGISGLSVVEHLMSKGKCLRIMDSRNLPPNAIKIKETLIQSQICFGRLNKQWIQEADVIVLSPGVSPSDPEIISNVKNDVEVIGDIELFAREAIMPYIAVTGSNGKSTVTTLVTEILMSQGINAKAGANIGEPALNLLTDPSIEMYVLELSSFQLETCSSISPSGAVVLNVSEDHLDRHQSFEEYSKIKQSIYSNAKNKVVLREDNGNSRLTSDVVSFGVDVPKGNNYGIRDYDSGRWLVRGSEKLVHSDDISLLGEAGELNVLAALALAEPYINDMASALSVVKSFSGLPHRCELVLTHKQIQWVDDSKGTNVGATVSAIIGLNKPIILILGGTHKGGSLESLIKSVDQNVKLVITFGKDKKIFSDALKDVSEVVEMSTLQSAVNYANQNAVSGDVVLFSPACASFDMFANYIERGNAFQSAVRECVLGSIDDNQ